jgi:flagellin
VIGSTVAGGAGTAAAIVIDATADASGASWNIVGTDANGKSISETIAGSGSTTFTSTGTKAFLTVTSITQTGAGTGIKIGTSGDDDGISGAAGNTTAGNIEMAGVMANARIELLHGADDMSSSSKAMHAVTVIDAAIKTVNTQRSELGAISNRLSHTVSNMTNISTNLSAARGGIEDADFAVETTQLAKNQILQQASTAMLAQANASKQNVLSLLQ